MHSSMLFSRWLRRSRGVALATVLLIPFHAHAERQAGLTETMNYVVGELAAVVAIAGAPKPLSDEQRLRLDRALTEIAEQGYLMAGHADDEDLGFMAFGLAQLVGALRQHHRRAENEDFERTLDQILAACSSCHQRKSSGQGSRFAEVLLDEGLLGTLAPRREAQVLIATRQFERAARVLDLALDQADGWASLRPLLVVRMDLGLRVVPDLPGLRARLERVAGDATLPQDARALVEEWRGALGQIAALPREQSVTVETAERLINEAQSVSGRGALPYYLEASRICVKLVEHPDTDPLKRAEAYRLAAVAEAGIDNSPLLPMRELYLEKAIRGAPGSETASQALAELEQLMDRRFDGRLPSYVEVHLDKLRSLSQ